MAIKKVLEAAAVKIDSGSMDHRRLHCLIIASAIATVAVASFGVAQAKGSDDPAAAPNLAPAHLVCSGARRSITNDGYVTSAAFTFELTIDSLHGSVVMDGHPIAVPVFTDDEISFQPPSSGLGRAYAAIITLGLRERDRMILGRKTGVFRTARSSGLCRPSGQATNLF